MSTLKVVNIQHPSAASATLILDSSGNLALPAGSASTPALQGPSDTNTGLFFPTADTIAFAEGGTEALRIDSSGRVGIGTSSPSQILDVQAGKVVASFTSTTGTTGAYQLFNNTGGNLYFGLDNSTGAEFASAYAGVMWHGGARPLLFATSNIERMRIDSAGRVGIGTTSLTEKLHVDGNIVTKLGGYGLLFGGSTCGINGDATTNYIQFYTNNVERARIDSSGRLLIGTSSSRSNVPGADVGVLIEGASGGPTNKRFVQHIFGSADGSGPYLGLGKHRGTSTGGNTIVVNGDELGGIYFQGADGADFRQGAYIVAFVDGTPGASDMPCRLVFATTADGASSPTERARINNAGEFSFRNTSYVFPATDNAVSLGLTGFRFSAVWAANGTIQTSDERAKADITDAALGSEFIKALRPVSYKWIEGGKRDTGERDEDENYIYESVPGTRTHWGFIAQEVKQAVDDAGVDFGGWVLTDKDDPDSQQALRYDQFIAPLTKALQETMAQLEALKAEVAALKAQ